jgi:DNA-binding transcriptional MerR regulator
MPSTEIRHPSTAASEAPRRLFYKIGSVCEMTDTQPYILRFWESEFPMLAPQKSRSGQRLYRERDIEMVRRIKSLLYEEGYTIAGARKRLEQEQVERGAGGGGPAEPEPPPAPVAARRPRPGSGEESERALKSLRQALKDVRRELQTVLRRLDR